MKKLFLITVFAATGSFCFGQKLNIQSTKVDKILTLKNDTLYVPMELCKFIKIGEKVYKINVTIEEVPEQSGSILYKGSNFTPYVQGYNLNLKTNQ